MKGGLSGRKVNHSGRKTTVTSLIHSNVEATTVMQLTGHKNVASVNEYSSASFNQQQHISNILTDIGTGSRGLIPQETNTSRSVNMNEDQSEFPNDDYIFNNIYLGNVVQTIENFESNIGEKNVTMNSGNSSKFSISPYASIGNNKYLWLRRVNWSHLYFYMLIC